MVGRTVISWVLAMYYSNLQVIYISSVKYLKILICDHISFSAYKVIVSQKNIWELA